jgi:transcriptional regulator with PAS, ATPase and Fis domain
MASTTGRVDLLERPDFFRLLMDNMRIGVIVSDADGYIIYINDTYARFLNIDPKAQIGKHAKDLGVNSRLHIVAQTGEAEVNYPHQLKESVYLVHRIPIKDGGRVMAVLGLVLFDSASTVKRLAQKVSFLRSKLDMVENELISLRSTKYTFESIVGEGVKIKSLKRQAVKAAATDLPVVITGESGTGKELFAQAIHNASRRKPFSFVRINCSAIPKDLLESELFGYEKGAFTGAQSHGKPGKFELARHGSVFLDEIGDLPLEMQPKLLRVLEEKEFERIGGTNLIKSDFRLIAATNQDLKEMLDTGRFREDLFYRLNVIPIHIPPLRERREDIPLMSSHFLDQAAHHAGTPKVKIDPKAQRALMAYDWPGNVRELSNLIERAVSYMEGDTIFLCDLPFYVQSTSQGKSRQSPAGLKTIQWRTEREVILHALETTQYNKARAAEFLGIHRSLVYKKMKKYAIPLSPQGNPRIKRVGD